MAMVIYSEDLDKAFCSYCGEIVSICSVCNKPFNFNANTTEMQGFDCFKIDNVFKHAHQEHEKIGIPNG